ncbi:hypothetical protein SS50377_26978 [Spironucleus salmonicida]|uniref:Uncharacterized protein n=1 Tax=Spironucleus salmonicida TaxID=348837 RepID=V6M2K5_9EUKA|nr:hypothetical protein SS50377_26978 [Spironucleus salmonicida]|eukprot:EST47489.1 Hypothetical protein SS50377_12475 [Spironucleus salmonicida]
MYGILTQSSPVQSQSLKNSKKLLSPNQKHYDNKFDQMVDKEVQKILNFNPSYFKAEEVQSQESIQTSKPQITQKLFKSDLISNQIFEKQRKKPEQSQPPWSNPSSQFVFPFTFLNDAIIIYRIQALHQQPTILLEKSINITPVPFNLVIEDLVLYKNKDKTKPKLTNLNAKLIFPFEYIVNDNLTTNIQPVVENIIPFPFQDIIIDIVIIKYITLKLVKTSSKLSSEFPHPFTELLLSCTIYKINLYISKQQEQNSSLIFPFKFKIDEIIAYTNDQDQPLNLEIKELRVKKNQIEAELSRAKTEKKKMKQQQLSIQLRNITGLLNAKTALKVELQK